MRVLRIGLALAVAMTAVGCDKETGPFFAPEVPLAYTRFINAVPDTVNLDWRFIDQLEYSPVEILQAFRGFSSYQATGPGARQLRVFTNPGGQYPDPTSVSTTLADETINLTAGSYYSIILAGYANPANGTQAALMVIEDPIPTDISSNVLIRAANLDPASTVDVYQTATATTAISGAPVFSGVGFGSVSSYTSIAPAALAFRMTSSGTTTPILASATAPPGAAGNPDTFLSTRGGVLQAGSAVTGYYFPRSVAGTRAPQGTAFQSPAIIYIVDKHPRD